MFRMARMFGVLCLAGTFLCAADSITVDGQKYNNVRIRESESRYYVEIVSQGRTISVPKDKVNPSDVVIEQPEEEAPVADAAAPATATGESGPLQAGATSFFVSSLTPNNDRLEVNALVLRAGDQMMALCAVDTSAVDRRFCTAVVRKIRQAQSGLKPENIMIAATHTYTCEFYLIKSPIEQVMFGDYAEDKFEYAVSRTGDAILTAERNLQPARIRFATGAAKGLSANHALQNTPVDETVTMALVEGQDGNPIAYIVNFAAQPNILRDKGISLGRDFPGGIAAELRRATGAQDMPVLFLNGAMGDVMPTPPEGRTPTERALLMGKAIAGEVLRLKDQATPVEEVRLQCRTRMIPLPPHMLQMFIPAETPLQDFWVNETAFLSLPGEVSSPIGLALRQKATERGAQHAFLVGLAGDYAGYHTDMQEFFESRDEATLSYYGPLIIAWYLDQHIPAPVVKPSEPWEYCPTIAEHREVFEAARERGKLNSESIRVQWEALDKKLSSLASILNRRAELPPEAKRVLDKVPANEAVEIGKQYAAYFVRHEKTGYTGEQRVVLMGVADGANLPFDAIMFLQFLSAPGALPKEAQGILAVLEVKGFNFLEEAGVAPAAVPAQS